MAVKREAVTLKNKRVLVSGGAGAIGSNLADRLARAHGCHVVVVDDFTQGSLSNIADLLKEKKITLIRGDINKKSVLDKAFSKKIEAVYHLAASFANELSVLNPIHDLECNIKGTLNLLLKSVRKKVRLFVYASSSSLYGPRKEICLDETLYPNPSTPYAVSKLTGEFYCNAIQELYGMATISLRFSNTYGPKDFPGRYRNVIPNFMKKAVLGQPLPITGAGSETRDYTYIDDCVDGILLASQNPKAYGGLFNLGTGKATKTIELAREILRVSGSKSKIQYLKPRYFDHIKNRMMNVDKAKKTFKYQARTALRQGIERTWAWFLRNKAEALRRK